jgi:hypothetical protein
MKQLDLFDSLAKDDKAKKEKKATYRKAYREANKEKIAAYRKAYKEANKEKIAARDKAYKEANKEKIAAKDKAYRVANKEKILAYRVANKEKIAAYGKAYRVVNKEKQAANKSCREAKRRALKLKQIPIHLRDCPQERQRLIQTYKLRNIISKATGVQHHVDHMWPLSDGGPHWSGNLQVITAYKNLSKSTSVCEATKSTIIKSLESFQSERTI